jgi:hypothetical protein
MPVLLITYFIITVLLMSPPWIFFKKRVTWHKWEYGVPIYSIVAWFITNEVEHINSFTNGIVEVLFVIVVASLSAWMRVVLPGKNKTESLFSSVAFTILPVLVAVIIRFTMVNLSD